MAGEPPHALEQLQKVAICREMHPVALCRQRLDPPWLLPPRGRGHRLAGPKFEWGLELEHWFGRPRRERIRKLGHWLGGPRRERIRKLGHWLGGPTRKCPLPVFEHALA